MADTPTRVEAMAVLSLEKKSQLEALHTGNVKESLTLEYKASQAIDKRDDNKKLEMARDVSAFANADGGQIVYGMTESDHEPAGLDEGADEKAYPEIWFEQVLQQHITPPIRLTDTPCAISQIEGGCCDRRARHERRSPPGLGR